MSIADALLLLSLTYAFIAFARQFAGGLYRSAALQAVVWGAGIGGVFLFSASQFGPNLALNGVTFRAANFATKLLIGFLIASPASVIRDALTAFDTSTSVALPPLFGSRRSAPAAPPAPPAKRVTR